MNNHTIRYITEGAAELAFLDHIDAATPADVFVVTFRQDEYLSLFAT